MTLLRGCATALLLMLAGGAARAEAPPTLELSAGAGVMAVPRYMGSGSVRLSPMPYASGAFGPNLEFDTLDGVRYTALRFGGFTAGAFARYREAQSASDLPMRLRGLGGVGQTVELGGFASYESGPFRLDTILVQDPARVHGGAMIESHATLSIPIGDPSLQQGIEIGPYVEIGNRAYLGRYLGVTPAQSAATGLPVFSPHGGLDVVGMQANASIRLADRWSIRGFAQWGRLMGGAAASPIVHDGGSRNQFSGGAFLVFTPWGGAP